MNAGARVLVIVAAVFVGCTAGAQEWSKNWDIAIWVSGSTGEGSGGNRLMANNSV